MKKLFVALFLVLGIALGYYGRAYFGRYFIYWVLGATWLALLFAAWLIRRRGQLLRQALEHMTPEQRESFGAKVKSGGGGT